MILLSWGPDLDTGDLDHEHGGPQNVPRVVAPELDPRHLLDLMEVDGLDLLHAVLQVRLRVQHVVRGDVAAIKQSHHYYIQNNYMYNATIYY